jgi:very-short-patch-repair endonuclease
MGPLGLPAPRVNYRVRVGGSTRYIDLAWPEKKVAVELDGFVPHSSRRVFDDDRVRQNDLVQAGWEVYRITWKAFAHDPAHAFRHVIAALVW